MADAAGLTFSFLRKHPRSAARVLEELPAESAVGYLLRVPPRLSAPVLARMMPASAARFLSHAGELYTLSVLPFMPATAGAAILRRLALPTTDRLLQQLPARQAFNLRLLLRYPANSVGAWMDPEIMVLPQDIDCGQAWQRIRDEEGPLDRYFYLIDQDQYLKGRVAGIDLLRADPEMPLERLSVAVSVTLQARGSLDKALHHDGWLSHDPMPVVSRDLRLLGVARHAMLLHAVEQGQAQQPDTVFTDTLLELVETYWQGISRLVEGPFSLLPSPARARGDKTARQDHEKDKEPTA